jgi:hypothetical protein
MTAQRFTFLAPIFIGLSLFSSSATRFDRCLPSGIKSTDVVSAQSIKSEIKKITVKEKLTELKARCKKGKLVDASGREIRFFKLTGCWGNPPVDYQEIMQRQNEELEKLRKRYTVIEMTCNPDGLLIH